MIAVDTVLSQAFSKTSSAKYPDEPLLASELDEALAEQKRVRELEKQRDGFLALAKAMANKTPNQEYTVRLSSEGEPST